MNQSVQDVIRNWPKEPQDSARRLIEYYGPPAEYSESELVWYRTRDGWKRTVLSREEVPHDFPSHHTDFLEQFIEFPLLLQGERRHEGRNISLLIPGSAADPICRHYCAALWDD